jgi:hypothetical protein
VSPIRSKKWHGFNGRFQLGSDLLFENMKDSLQYQERREATDAASIEGKQSQILNACRH